MVGKLVAAAEVAVAVVGVVVGVVVEEEESLDRCHSVVEDALDTKCKHTDSKNRNMYKVSPGTLP